MPSIERTTASPLSEAVTMLSGRLSWHGIFPSGQAEQIAGCIGGLAGESFAVGDCYFAKNGMPLRAGEVGLIIGDAEGEGEKLVMVFSKQSLSVYRSGGGSKLDYTTSSPVDDVLAERLENPPRDVYIFSLKDGRKIRMGRGADGQIGISL